MRRDRVRKLREKSAPGAGFFIHYLLIIYNGGDCIVRASPIFLDMLFDGNGPT
jgi:hypothetical protein